MVGVVEDEGWLGAAGWSEPTGPGAVEELELEDKAEVVGAVEDEADVVGAVEDEAETVGAGPDECKAADIIVKAAAVNVIATLLPRRLSGVLRNAKPLPSLTR